MSMVPMARDSHTAPSQSLNNPIPMTSHAACLPGMHLPTFFYHNSIHSLMHLNSHQKDSSSCFESATISRRKGLWPQIKTIHTLLLLKSWRMNQPMTPNQQVTLNHTLICAHPPLMNPALWTICP